MHFLQDNAAEYLDTITANVFFSHLHYTAVTSALLTYTRLCVVSIGLQHDIYSCYSVMGQNR